MGRNGPYPRGHDPVWVVGLVILGGPGARVEIFRDMCAALMPASLGAQQGSSEHRMKGTTPPMRKSTKLIVALGRQSPETVET